MGVNYAEVIGGAILFAPKTIDLNGKTIANPTPDMLLSAGYLPVENVPAPPDEPGFYWEPSWKQGPDKIVQVWTKKELPPEEPSLEETVAKQAEEINNLTLMMADILGGAV